MPKILVIDDEAVIVELIKLKLEREGFEVFTAADGIDGLSVASKIKPDLIILDVLMPRMDGFQFYKEIKKLPETSHIPVLVMTARGAMKDSFEGLGVESFLVKPFEPDELLRQVKNILDAAPANLKPAKAKTALIAGGDEKRLDEMRRQLQEKGYKVELATDGPAALTKALQLLPDLFVVQFDMPQMNAEEIINIFNKYPDASKTSIVVYSLLETKEQVAHSQWGSFLSYDRKKEIRGKEAPLKIIEKFDSRSFLEKIKDFL